MKVIGLITKYLFKTAFSIIFLSISIVIILFVSYLLGHPILDGNIDKIQHALVGNDSPFALSLVYWFDRFYPQIPIWYPLQGMGVSLFYSYPMSTTFLIIVLKKIFSVSAVEMYRILSFAAFPLTAIGIYLLGWIGTKKQSIGLISALFFLISQASWLFQTLHGIFAQSFSLITVAPTFIFFNLFINEFTKDKKQNLLVRVYFVFCVLFLGISFFAHAVTGTMITGAIIIWSILNFILIPKFNLSFGWLIGRAIKGLLIAGVIAIVTQLLMAFWLFPFNSYTSLANREGLNTRSVQQIQEESLKLPTILGLGVMGEGQYRYDFFFFAAPVLIFFVIGVIMSIVLNNKKIQILSILSIFFILLTTIPIYFPFAASLLKFFFTAVYFRGLIPALILVPIVAAWGVWSLPYIILQIPYKHIFKKALIIEKTNSSKLITLTGEYLISLIVAVIALFTAWQSVILISHKPPRNPEYVSTYKYEFDSYGPSLSNEFSTLLKKKEKFFPYNLSLKVDLVGIEERTVINKELGIRLDIDKSTIVDVSPYAAGGVIMQSVGLVNDLKFSNLYHYYASLIHGMWGYQAGVFYGKEPLYKSSKLLSDLSDWFGLKYVILTPGFDPFEKYKEAGWVPVESFNKYANSQKPELNMGPWGIEVWENPDANGLYTATNRPVILAIGDYKKGFYDHVFRSANLGALAYDNALIVEGSKNIDDYSLDQIKQFDGLILHGYSYKFWNKSGSWNMVQKFIEEGGSVFVDTGWQYIAKDWGQNEGKSNTPSIFPVKLVEWSNIGTTWEGTEINTEYANEIDLNKFDPPVWDGNPWGMSLGDIDNLREGSTPILTNNGKVIIAERKLGRGKLIWSGMNILSHITLKMNEDEALFLNKLWQPLFVNRQYKDFHKISFARDNPDNVVINFNESINESVWFLFRESYSPYWQARFNQENKVNKLTIYRAGPGFILVRLPKVAIGDSLNLSIKLNWFEGFFAKIISLVTLVCIILYIPFGGKIKGINILPHGRKIVNNFKAKSSIKISSISKEEEDY